MNGAIEDSSSPANEYIDHIFQIMRENERFLWLNTESVYSEVVELTNDYIDYLPRGPEEIRATAYVKSSMAYFLFHVLMPLGSGIYINLISGNLPMCFSQLRTAHETLAKSYLSDSRYADIEFFQDKLLKLEQDTQRNKTSISSLMKEFDEVLGIDNKSIALWGKLSQGWIHPRGIMEHIVHQITNKSDIPSWALVIPMKYSKNDFDSLEELGKRVAEFRKILSFSMGKYY